MDEMDEFGFQNADSKPNNQAQEPKQQNAPAQSDLVEFVDINPEDRKPRIKRNGLRVKDFVTGNVLTRDQIVRQFPFFVFLVLLAIFYIGNHYRYERLMRAEQKLRTEVREMRAESVSTAAQLMQISRQTQVLKLVQQQGLELQESVIPPKKVD